MMIFKMVLVLKVNILNHQTLMIINSKLVFQNENYYNFFEFYEFILQEAKKTAVSFNYFFPVIVIYNVFLVIVIYKAKIL